VSCRRDGGKALHTRGPATIKLLSPYISLSEVSQIKSHPFPIPAIIIFVNFAALAHIL